MIIMVCIPSVFICVISLAYLNIEYARKNLRDDLQLVTDITSDHLTAAVAYGDKKKAINILSSLKRNTAFRYACLYNENREIIYDLYYNNIGKANCNTNNQDKNLEVFQSTIKQKDINLGYLQIHASLSEISTFIKSYILLILGFTTAVIAFISIPLANILQKQISNPLYELLETSLKLTPPLNNSIEKTRKTNELLFLVMVLKKVRKTLSNHQYNIEKIDTILNNKEIFLSALEEKRNKSLTVRRTVRDLNQNDPYQDPEELYYFYVGLSDAQDKEMDQLMTILKELHIYESTAFKNDTRSTADAEFVLTEFEEYLKNHPGFNPNITLNNINDNWHVQVYNYAFMKCLESIFELLQSICLENQKYKLTIEPFINKYAYISFTVETNHHEEEIAHFDFENINIDTSLLKAKYYSNINNPKSSGLMIELDQELVKITLCPDQII